MKYNVAVNNTTFAGASPPALTSHEIIFLRGVRQVSIEERRMLMGIMHAPSPPLIAAVFFDKPLEDCKAHVATRRGHPTISNPSAAGGGRIVEGFAKKLVPPSTSEGFGHVFTVSSHEESEELLRSVFESEPVELKSTLCKFPRTIHLFDAGGEAVTRDDLVMSASDGAAWLKDATVTVEEKIDGANLGVSLGSDYAPLFQNRSHFVNCASATQWKGLDRWWSENSTMLCQVLEPERHILFGEWLAVKHSIHYTALPSYFVAFDVYDQIEQKFFSRSHLQEFLEPTGIPVVHTITCQQFGSPMEILPLLETISVYGARTDVGGGSVDGPVEGVYLRVDDGLWLQKRCKIVRPDFVHGIEKHWSTKMVVKNQIKF